MEKDSFFVQLKEHIEEYAEDRLLLMKLQVAEKAAEASSALFIGVVVTFFALLIFMIISFIAGYYLSQAVGSYPGGFAILGGLYILFVILLLKMHKKFTAKIISDKVVEFSLKSKDTFSDEI